MRSITKMTIKAVERIFDIKIVRPYHLPLVFEQIHLKKLFERYQIDCVFDVGANEGQYARMIRDQVRYRGPIVSFEPIPSIAEVLVSHAMRDQNWFVQQVALDSLIGVRKFKIMNANKFNSFHPERDSVGIFSDHMKVLSESISTDLK